MERQQPNRPITILYLIDTSIPTQGNGSTGGAERQLYLLASCLEPERFRPIVAQLSPNGASSGTNGRIGAGYAFSFPVRRLYDFKGLWRILQLTRLVRHEKVDIIHTYFEKSEVIGWMMTLLTRTPIWITSRRDLGFKRKKVYDRIFRLAAPSCTRCIAVCDAVRERVNLNGGLSPDRVEVIYNGLDLAAHRPPIGASTIRGQLGVDDMAPLVGMVANFNFEIKGHRYFLEAARLVLQEMPRVDFLLVGDGALRGKYEDAALALGIRDRVHFLGMRDDVPTILAELSISVLSSTSEGLSNVLLESMAAGKPIVATQVGGNSEIVVDGVTGYLVPPADPRALAAAVLRLLMNPGTAAEMGAVGRRRVEKDFSVEAMVRSHERLYQSLVMKTPSTQLQI